MDLPSQPASQADQMSPRHALEKVHPPVHPGRREGRGAPRAGRPAGLWLPRVGDRVTPEERGRQLGKPGGPGDGRLPRLCPLTEPRGSGEQTVSVAASPSKCQGLSEELRAPMGGTRLKA